MYMHDAPQLEGGGVSSDVLMKQLRQESRQAAQGNQNSEAKQRSLASLRTYVTDVFVTGNIKAARAEGLILKETYRYYVDIISWITKAPDSDYADIGQEFTNRNLYYNVNWLLEQVNTRDCATELAQRQMPPARAALRDALQHFLVSLESTNREAQAYQESRLLEVRNALEFLIDRRRADVQSQAPSELQELPQAEVEIYGLEQHVFGARLQYATDKNKLGPLMPRWLELARAMLQSGLLSARRPDSITGWEAISCSAEALAQGLSGIDKSPIPGTAVWVLPWQVQRAQSSCLSLAAHARGKDGAAALTDYHAASTALDDWLASLSAAACGDKDEADTRARKDLPLMGRLLKELDEVQRHDGQRLPAVFRPHDSQGHDKDTPLRIYCMIDAATRRSTLIDLTRPDSVFRHEVVGAIDADAVHALCEHVARYPAGRVLITLPGRQTACIDTTGERTFFEWLGLIAGGVGLVALGLTLVGLPCLSLIALSAGMTAVSAAGNSIDRARLGTLDATTATLDVLTLASSICGLTVLSGTLRVGRAAGALAQLERFARQRFFLLTAGATADALQIVIMLPDYARQVDDILASKEQSAAEKQRAIGLLLAQLSVTTALTILSIRDVHGSAPRPNKGGDIYLSTDAEGRPIYSVKEAVDPSLRRKDKNLDTEGPSAGSELKALSDSELGLRMNQEGRLSKEDLAQLAAYRKEGAEKYGVKQARIKISDADLDAEGADATFSARKDEYTFRKEMTIDQYTHEPLHREQFVNVFKGDLQVWEMNLTAIYSEIDVHEVQLFMNRQQGHLATAEFYRRALRKYYTQLEERLVKSKPLAQKGAAFEGIDIDRMLADLRAAQGLLDADGVPSLAPKISEQYLQMIARTPKVGAQSIDTAEQGAMTVRIEKPNY